MEQYEEIDHLKIITEIMHKYDNKFYTNLIIFNCENKNIIQNQVLHKNRTNK